MKSIVLIGFMGSGKSTVGRVLAENLGLPFIDLDEEIEVEACMGVPEIFSREGESGFRNRESRVLKRVLRGEQAVAACGGGVVTVEENIRELRERAVVFLLSVPLDEALRRIKDDGVERPLLAGPEWEEKARRLLEDRRESYLRAAHEVVEADEASPEEIAREIARRWRRYV